METISTWSWMWIAFIAFWVIVLIWIKGTDPRSNDIWGVLWLIVKIILVIGSGGLLIIFVLGSSKR